MRTLTAALPRLRLIVRNRLRTATNSFGLLREYLDRPSFVPDSFVPEEDLHRVGGTDPVFIRPPSLSPVHRNESVEMLMNWKDSGTSTKSDAEVNRLVNGVLLDPNFKLEDLRGFNVAGGNQQSDAAEKKFPFFNSFQTADIDIEVPSGTSGIPPGTFSVPGLVYWKLTAIIQASFSSPLASHFHFLPFKLFHRSPSGVEERVFSEVYNSDVFIEGILKRGRKMSKEESLIVSLQTQFALKTELCGHYETDLKARDELVEILGKKVANLEKDETQRKNALRSLKKVQDLNGLCRVVDEASSEALRIFHRQIATLEREKNEWLKREQGLREEVETLNLERDEVS